MHKNVTWTYYQAGHMMYIDNDSSAKLKKDIGEFLAASLPKDTIQ
jgi:carboxypeptidase C (cathepsin A)